MIKLSELVPLNLASEKEKFFASYFKYNPQFIYANKIDLKELNKYGKPKLWYLFLATKILKKYQQSAEYRSARSITAQEFLTQEKVYAAFFRHLTQYGLEKDYQIVFSDNFVSRVAINLKNKEVKIALPIKITSEEISGILAHEIDTHLLRQHNYEHQVWFKKKKKYGFKDYLRTEEGLAIINEMISMNQKLAYKSAINYLAVNLALKKDFVTVFNFFYQIWQDSERAWTWTFKKKRGLADTSQKGAYTKDLVYFEGLMETLKYLKKNNNNPSELYYGKINLKDVAKAKKIGTTEKIILPKIFAENKEFYKQTVVEIIKNNLF